MQILYVDPFEKKPTVKDDYLKAEGKEVSADYFLFNCREEEQTCKAIDDVYLQQKRWPELYSASSTLAFPASDLVPVLDRLMVWYQEHFPKLRTDHVLDYGNCGDVIPPFAFLVLDLTKIATKQFGQAPTWDSEKPEIIEFWTRVREALLKTFPHLGDRMIAYLAWSRSPLKEPKFDLASLPPVGRFFPLLARSRRTASNRGSQHGGSRNNSSGPDRSSNDSRSRPPRSDERPSQVQAAPRVRPSPEQGRSSEGAPRSMPTGNHQGSSADDTNGDEQGGGAEREAQVIAEVDKAIQVLKTKPALKELRLTPQNSFLRRLQHKRVKELGYQSFSVGESRNRSVKIVREETE